MSGEFGLASLKKEGMCHSYSDPSINPWYRYGKQFESFFKKEYEAFYYKPFLPILKKVSSKAWDTALLTHAKMEAK